MATPFDSVVQQQIAAVREGGLPDRLLLQRFVETGDEAAFALLIRRHTAMVLGVCRSVLSRDAEDACQATFLLLARKAANIRNPDALAGWLHAVAHRTAGKARTEAARRRSCEKQASVPECQVSADDLSWREVAGALHEELGRLPEQYRLPLILCCLEGRTRDEAARQLGWGVGKLKGMLDRGRRLLRRRLERRGLSLSAALLAGTLGRPAVSPAASEAITHACRAYMRGHLHAPAADLANRSLGIATSRVRLTALFLATAVAGACASVLLASRTAADDQPPVASNQGQPARTARPDGDGEPLPPGAMARMGTRRFLAGATSRQVAFSPNGRQILVSDWGGFTVLNAGTGKQVRRVDTSPGVVNSLSLSSDGKRVALGLDTNDEKKCPSGVQVRDVESGRLLRQCKDPVGRQQYLRVQFSPDGKAVTSYSYPARTVHLWDAGTGREIRHWLVSADSAYSPVFTPDGKTLVAADRRAILFWDVATGREVRRISDHPGAVVYQLEVSPDGKLLASQALKEKPAVDVAYRLDGRIFLWDIATGKRIGEIEYRANPDRFPPSLRPDTADVAHFHFSPDSTTLVTTGGDGILSVWDLAVGGKLLRQWEAAEWGNEFAFSPDGKALAVSCGATAVRLWDPATGKETRKRPGHHSGVYHLALSPDGRTLASAGQPREILLWDAMTGRELRRFTTADWRLLDMRFSGDGNALITTSDNTVVHVRDARTGAELRQFAAPPIGKTERRVLSPDGKLSASILEMWKEPRNEAGVIVWDSATGQEVRRFTDATWPEVVGFSSGGKSVLVWSGRTQIRERDVATGKVLRDVEAGDGITSTGRFSPDGSWFVCNGRDETLLLYYLQTDGGHRRLDPPSAAAIQSTYEFSPDSRTLALGDYKGIRLYETASGKIRRSLDGGHVVAMTFSVDCRRLYSGSSDTTVLAWDLTGREGAAPVAAELSAAEADARWAGLASEDAAVAYCALWALAESPGRAVAFLGDHLRPLQPAGADHLRRLIEQLDAAEFAVRDAASKELEGLGEQAETALRRALAGGLFPEQRRRAEALVARIDTARVEPAPATLREIRAVEVLERIGTPEAIRLLRDLAAGVPEARLTRESAASLTRLTLRAKAGP